MPRLVSGYNIKDLNDTYLHTICTQERVISAVPPYIVHPPPPPPITKHMCLNSKLCINMTQALGLADNMHPISRGGGGGGGWLVTNGKEPQDHKTHTAFDNITGRVLENSRNCFADLRSQKYSKKQTKKLFCLKLRCCILITNMYNLLLLLLGAPKHPLIGVTHIHLSFSLWIKVTKIQF